MRSYFLFLLAAFIFFQSLPSQAADAGVAALKMEAYDKYINNNKEGRSIVASMAFVCVKKGEEYASEGNSSFSDEDLELNMADQCVVEAEKMLASNYTAKMTKKNLAPIIDELMGDHIIREYIMLCAVGSLGAGLTSYNRDHKFMNYEMRIATATGIMDAAREQWLK